MIDKVKVSRVLKFQLSRIMYHETNNSMIRIDLTEKCDLMCKNCSKFCGVAKSDREVSIDQIQRFVDEARMKKKQWRNIFLSGGEPTLHSKFDEVLRILNEYAEEYDCYVAIISHSSEVKYDNKYTRVMKAIQSGMTEKATTRKAANISPVDFVDLSDDEYEKGCKTCKDCGYGFSMYGYYMCPIGCSVDRLLGLDIGAKTYDELAVKEVEQRRQLCKYCAMFFLNAEYQDTNDVSAKIATLEGFNIGKDEEYFSESKKKLIDEYNNSPKLMTLY